MINRLNQGLTLQNRGPKREFINFPRAHRQNRRSWDGGFNFTKDQGLKRKEQGLDLIIFELDRTAG